MATNITAVDTFTDPVVAPADGDAVAGAAPGLMGQGLANRTLHNKNRLDANDALIAAAGEYCECLVVASGVAGAAELTLTIEHQSGGFTVSGNNIVITNAGTYVASMSLVASEATSTTNPLTVKLDMKIGGTNFADASGRRWTGDITHEFPINVCDRVFTATAAQEFSVTVGTGGSDIYSDGGSNPNLNALHIRRIA